MSKREVMLLLALLAAGCAAIGLYVVAYDAFGLARESIVTDSLGSAAVLGLAWLVATLGGYRTK